MGHDHMRITKSGIYRDFPEEAYFADPAPIPSLTQSIAKTLIDYSPAHALLEHPRLRPAKSETDKYESNRAIGNAAHRLFTGRGRDVHVVDYADFRSKAAQEIREDK